MESSRLPRFKRSTKVASMQLTEREREITRLVYRHRFLRSHQIIALVGDSADGFPGVPGWGKKAAASTLSNYPHLEDIPKDWRNWVSSIRNARSLSESLFSHWQDAQLFRTLATLRTDVPVFNSIEELLWKGTRPDFEDFYAGKL
jgi:5'-3' exonuclease